MSASSLANLLKALQKFALHGVSQFDNFDQAGYSVLMNLSFLWIFIATIGICLVLSIPAYVLEKKNGQFTPLELVLPLVSFGTWLGLLLTLNKPIKSLGNMAVETPVLMAFNISMSYLKYHYFKRKNDSLARLTVVYFIFAAMLFSLVPTLPE